MSYAEYLIQMLKPLGTYSLENESYTRAELDVLGKAFDDCCGDIEILERECVVPTAEDYGISMYEKILPKNYGVTVSARRAAVISMLSINNSCFTEELLNSTLSGCGEPTTVEESGEKNQVIVSFTDVEGKPTNFSLLKNWIENILPCHIEVLYAFDLQND